MKNIFMAHVIFIRAVMINGNLNQLNYLLKNFYRCQRRAHENLPENPCPVHNFIFYPEDYIEQSYPEETATLCNVIGGGNSFQQYVS